MSLFFPLPNQCIQISTLKSTPLPEPLALPSMPADTLQAKSSVGKLTLPVDEARHKEEEGGRGSPTTACGTARHSPVNHILELENRKGYDDGS